MTKQIKVFFVFLAIMAIVSVFSFFDGFRGVRSAILSSETSPLPNPDIDTDHDGLSDSDESYWNTDFQNPDTDGDGFLDGEEISSGFDPREPSSHEFGDALIDTVYGAPKKVDIDFNLTEDLTGTMVQGIYAGDLRPGTDNDKFQTGINAISLSVIDNFTKSQAPSSAPNPTYNIVASGKENTISYLKSASQIIQDDLLNFPQKADLNTDITSQLPFFAAKSEQFNISYTKISKLAIPEDWLDIHKDILSLLYRSYLNYHYIANYESDMMKATLAMAELSNLHIELPSVLQAIKSRMTSQNISIDGDFYQILDLLYATANSK